MAERKPAKSKSTERLPEQFANDFFPTGLGEIATAVARWNRLTLAERGQVDFTAASLDNRDLTGIKLNGVKRAEAVDFTDSNLTSARITGAFPRASFANANLTQAYLHEAECLQADFTGAKLSGADLSKGYFRKARFVNADLTNANLQAADLTIADFTGATLTNTVFSGALMNHETIWPQGFVPPPDIVWRGKGTDPRLSGKGKGAVAADINGLLTRLHEMIDAKRMKRTLDMLQQEKQQLFSEVEPTMVRGIVRSQKEPDLYYSCVLTDDGTYSCCTPDVAKCMGLSNEPCKHLLTLVIGLARSGQLDPTIADRWLVAAQGKNPRWGKKVQNYLCDSLIKYKGVVAGEIDWRPTETIPEDYYSM